MADHTVSHFSPWATALDALKFFKNKFQEILKVLWIPALFCIIAYFMETRLIQYLSKPILLVFLLKMVAFYIDCYVGVYIIRFLMLGEKSTESVVAPTLKRPHGKFSFYLIFVDLITSLSFMPLASFFKGGIGMNDISTIALVLGASLLISTALLLRIQFLSVEASLDKKFEFALLWKRSGLVWGSYFMATLMANILYYLTIGFLFVALPVLVWGKEAVLGEIFHYMAFFNFIFLIGKILNYYLATVFYKKTL
jgi:hypothetical protein